MNKQFLVYTYSWILHKVYIFVAEGRYSSYFKNTLKLHQFIIITKYRVGHEKVARVRRLD